MYLLLTQLLSICVFLTFVGQLLELQKVALVNTYADYI